WSARAEGVARLDDLLLRRVRLGLLLPDGGSECLPRIRAIVQPELGWSDARWEAEETAYRALVAASYSLPEESTIPDWEAMLRQREEAETAAGAARRAQVRKRGRQGGLLLLVAAALLIVLWLRRWYASNDERA